MKPILESNFSGLVGKMWVVGGPVGTEHAPSSGAARFPRRLPVENVINLNSIRENGQEKAVYSECEPPF